MTGFTIVWAGQIVSVLASSMTNFGVTIWVYEKTGSAAALGLITSIFVVPMMFLSPVAGVMVDRYNRKAMMMVSDLIAVCATCGLLVANGHGQLEMWQLYVASLLIGIGNCFQWPAYSAAISTMVPKQHYQRASGMMSLVESGPSVLGPILAGALLPFIGLTGILTLDVATFFVAIATLVLVAVPNGVAGNGSGEGQASNLESGKLPAGNRVASFFREATFGFRYIFRRHGLLALLIFFVTLNFVGGFGWNVFAPMVLARTGNSSESLGFAQSAAAVGAVLGGVLISLWGGFRRRMTSIFLGEAGIGLLGLLLVGLGPSLPFWAMAAALGAVCQPLSNGGSQAIWQSKVAPELQGRVFSARRLIAWLPLPLVPVLAGALADNFTEPAMQAPSRLAQVFGPLVGTSPGSGMSLQFVVSGAVYLIVVLCGLLFFPALRHLEERLPDHDASPAT